MVERVGNRGLKQRDMGKEGDRLWVPQIWNNVLPEHMHNPIGETQELFVFFCR